MTKKIVLTAGILSSLSLSLVGISSYLSLKHIGSQPSPKEIIRLDRGRQWERGTDCCVVPSRRKVGWEGWGSLCQGVSLPVFQNETTRKTI
ncbi:hypothetical protein QBC39DRAFT_363880, partial [Podospora conica]